MNALFLALLVLTDWDFKKRIESLNFDNPDFELLILGNSLALDGFDTELISSQRFKSYNLALGGSSMYTNYIQLNEYLKSYNTKPKYIIIGLGSYMGSFDAEIIHPIVEFTMKDHRYTFDDLPLIKFRWLTIEFAKKIISKAHRKARLSNGQLKFQKEVPDATHTDSNGALDISYYQDSFYLGELAATSKKK